MPALPQASFRPRMPSGAAPNCDRSTMSCRTSGMSRTWIVHRPAGTKDWPRSSNGEWRPSSMAGMTGMPGSRGWPLRVERCAAPARCGTVPLTGYGEVGETDRSYSVGLLLFYALSQVMGSERFDRACRSFFQACSQAGAGTGDLQAQFRQEDPAVQSILEDWLTSTRGLRRLEAGEDVGAIIEGYRAR